MSFTSRFRGRRTSSVPVGKAVSARGHRSWEARLDTTLERLPPGPGCLRLERPVLRREREVGLQVLHVRAVQGTCAEAARFATGFHLPRATRQARSLLRENAFAAAVSHCFDGIPDQRREGEQPIGWRRPRLSVPNCFLGGPSASPLGHRPPKSGRPAPNRPRNPDGPRQIR